MRFAVAAVALALAACNTGFEPQYLVKDLRILAVRVQVAGANAADAAPGDTVEVRALVANPLGRAGLAVSFYGCLPRADEALSPCAELAVLNDPERLAGTPGFLELGTCSPAGDTCAVAYPVPAGNTPEGIAVAQALQFVKDRAAADPPFQCQLFVELPLIVVARAGDRREVAVKQLRITLPPEELEGTSYVRNTNPVAADVVLAPPGTESCAGGTAISSGTTLPAGESAICGAHASGSIQRFKVCDDRGVREEVLEDVSWQWYATAGEFPEFEGVGNATGSPVDFVPGPGPFTLWAILRDGRGGESWLDLRDLSGP